MPVTCTFTPRSTRDPPDGIATHGHAPAPSSMWICASPKYFRTVAWCCGARYWDRLPPTNVAGVLSGCAGAGRNSPISPILRWNTSTFILHASLHRNSSATAQHQGYARVSVGVRGHGVGVDKPTHRPSLTSRFWATNCTIVWFCGADATAARLSGQRLHQHAPLGTAAVRPPARPHRQQLEQRSLRLLPRRELR